MVVLRIRWKYSIRQRRSNQWAASMLQPSAVILLAPLICHSCLIPMIGFSKETEMVRYVESFIVRIQLVSLWRPGSATCKWEEGEILWRSFNPRWKAGESEACVISRGRSGCPRPRRDNGFAPPSSFCSVWFLSILDDALHIGDGLIPMLLSSGDVSQTHREKVFYQLSGHLLAQDMDT